MGAWTKELEQMVATTSRLALKAKGSSHYRCEVLQAKLWLGALRNDNVCHSDGCIGHYVVTHHEGYCALDARTKEGRVSLRPLFFSPSIIGGPDGDW